MYRPPTATDQPVRGSSSVYQDLAVVPLMPVWRNFFLGSEETNGFWPIRRLKVDQMRETAKEELHKMGIDLPDVDAPIGRTRRKR